MPKRPPLVPILLMLLSAVAATSVLHRADPAGAADDPAASPATPDDPGLAFFHDAVLPILEARCLECHGGGEDGRSRGGLNMTTRDALIAGGTSGIAVHLDEPEASLLLRAVSYTDRDYEMPPTGKLPQHEIDTLTQWVAMGLPWPEGLSLAGEHHDAPPAVDPRTWWAYQPVQPVEPPTVDDTQWNAHPIDAFVYARLHDAGLEPNGEADRVTLIRRVTFDLIGLPPTPEEVAAFVADESPDAWMHLVERLLASPHYGEKWGRHWLDVVRYAETDGYERDGKKLNIWRYRDYVTRSFNDDKPYDRFILEQLAGDLLPDAATNPDALLATGYQRLQVWDDEPVDRVQGRADYIADIVDTTSFAFLGSSIGCARCHDHKIDPFTQADYYSLYAFFNHITEPRRGDATAIAVDVVDPTRDADLVAAHAAWEARLDELDASIRAARSDFRDASGERFERGDLTPIADDGRADPQPWAYHRGDPGDGWQLQQFSHADWPVADGGFGRGIERDWLHADWPDVSDADATGGTLYLRRLFRLIELPEHLTLAVAHDDTAEVYVNGILVYRHDQPTPAEHRLIQLPAEALNALVVGSNSLAVRCTDVAGHRFIDVGLHGGVVDPRVALLASLDARGAAVLGAERADAYRAAVAEADRLRAAPPMHAYPATIVAEREGDKPDQFVHTRGNANAEGDAVVPAYPAILMPEGVDPAAPEGGRLTLARWIASPDNPMTARVMANRVWQHHFGRGLARTASDFGQLGDAPTHPLLLDFLAAHFVESGWSVKALHRLILSSRAYRMSSAGHLAGLARDPLNDLFWRFDVRRLTAEEYRDAILAVNGTLNPQLFGPEVYPPLPEEVLATASRPDVAWGHSPPAQQDRRSLYIHVKRSLREPFLAAFDQAETDSPCPVRFVTTVPTQSLIALNSDFMQREAGRLAARLAREADTLDAQVRLGLTLALSREPTNDEVAAHTAFVQRMQAEHGIEDAEAIRLFCLTVYNLNEFLFLD